MESIMGTKLYHYTINSKLADIEQAGYLQRSPLKPDRKEKPVVWLSSDDNFENSARKMAFNPKTQQQHLMTTDEMINLTGALVRYVFVANDIDARTWNDARRDTGMSRNRRDLLLERAELVASNPNDWWVTFSEIELTKAIRVEMCNEIASNGELIWQSMKNTINTTNNIIISMTHEQLAKSVSLDIDGAWRNAG